MPSDDCSEDSSDSATRSSDSATAALGGGAGGDVVPNGQFRLLSGQSVAAQRGADARRRTALRLPSTRALAAPSRAESIGASETGRSGSERSPQRGGHFRAITLTAAQREIGLIHGSQLSQND